MTLEETIRTLFNETLEANGHAGRSVLTRETALLQSGLDSLGFAILVARLEEVLGYDPFVLMSDAVYPRTFGEFVDIYERHKPVV